MCHDCAAFRRERAFARRLRAARTFWRGHRHPNVPYGNVRSQEGFPLARWIADKRRSPQQLTQEQLNALEALDMRWIPRPRRVAD
ncbi:helicase associated domain-containing protein [Streptomyces sp. NPDC054765]